MVACETGVMGAWEYAFSKTMPCLASASRWGVSAFVEPRKPMRSARNVSRVMRITLGLAAPVPPSASAKKRARPRSCRIKEKGVCIVADSFFRDSKPGCAAQKRSFTPSCMARGPPWERKGLPELTSGVVAIVEKLPLVAVLLVGTELKLGWFKTLKISQRNWRLTRSVILVVLLRLASHCTKCGPRRLLRPQVPTVPGAGMLKMAAAFVIVGLLGSLNW